MKQNLTLILMNEAVREGWREWMEKVRRVLPQTDAERPVTWIAAERLARENGRMVRLVELLREHRPVLSYRVKEEAGLLILVAYHRHGSSSDFLLETAEAYFRERDCGGFLFLCRMQASINAYDEYPHLNVLCNRLAGLLFRFRRERASEYRKGIPPMFGKADLQEVEKYLPHLRGCSFREENRTGSAQGEERGGTGTGMRHVGQYAGTAFQGGAEHHSAPLADGTAEGARDLPAGGHGHAPSRDCRRVRLRHSELPVGLLQEAPEGYSCRNP